MLKKKKIKVWKIAAAAVVAVLIIRFAAGLFLGGDEEFIPTVETKEAVEGTITSTLDTSGTIASEVTRVYASPVNALVGEVPVVLGQTVHKGEYLLTYDTASLQRSYDIAELQAKAENAAGNDTLSKSRESAGELAASAKDIATLQAQADAIQAELSALQAQATENEIQTNNNTQVNGEIGALTAEVETFTAQIAELEAKKEQKTLSEKEKERLKQLYKEKKSKEQMIEKKQGSIKSAADLANTMTNIQAQIAQKNSQLAEVQSKLGEAQSKNASAEAGILSEAARANISYTQQAGKLTLEQSADDLSRAKAGVTADFEGIVTEVTAAAGTAAAEGSPLITLASADHMCLDVLVSKYNLAHLAENQTASITFGEKEYSGVVSYISKLAQKGESGAAMVTVKVHIDNPDDNLILGLDAKASICLGTADNVLTVPISAVNSDSEGDFVYTVNEQIVTKKYVTTGLASTEEIEIKKGIETGEKVITTVDSTITEGMKVTEVLPQDLEDVPATQAEE